MSDVDRCQWGGCDRPAQYGLVFSSPAERVDYCEECITEAKLELDFAQVIPL